MFLFEVDLGQLYAIQGQNRHCKVGSLKEVTKEYLGSASTVVS